MDSTSTYVCNVINANPAPSVHWIVNGEKMKSTSLKMVPPSQDSEFSSSNQHHQTGWNVRSELSLSVVEEESQLSLTCVAISPGVGSSSISKSTNRNILVLSKLSVLINVLHLD